MRGHFQLWPRQMRRFRPLLVTLAAAILGFSSGMCLLTLRSLPGVVGPVCSGKSPDGGHWSSESLPGQESSAELPPPGFLFVGVMSAAKYLDTRGKSIYETWARTMAADGHLAFFVSPSTSSSHALPLVRLENVDDTYPPQNKSFAMLKYMYERLADRYEWFMRADDDVYVRMDKLEVMLRSLNSSQPLFIGQAGLGTPEEYGQLSLADGENYCMGGPGIILSRETLRRMAPYIDECIRSMVTTHEDVELGRCVRRFAGVTCTWSYEMQSLFYNNQSGMSAYTGELNVPEIHHSVSLHPIKNSTTVRRVHSFIRRLKLSDLRFRSLQLHRDVLMTLRELELRGVTLNDEIEREADLALVPSLNKFTPSKHDDILTWDFFTSTTLFCSSGANCPRHNLESYYRGAINDVVQQVMDIMNKYARQRGRMLEYQDVLYGYRRVDPLHGADMILDLLLLYKKFKGRRMTVPVRRHAYLQQNFGELRALDADKLWPNPNGQQTEIYFILPISGRLATFVRFLELFERVCLQNGEMVRLYVVMFHSDNEETEAIRQHVRQLSQRYDYRSQRIRLFELNGEFNRGAALSHGAAQCPPNALMFFTDVDVVFERQLLFRIRMNTVEHGQVFFPVVFSEYDQRYRSREATLISSDQSTYSASSGYFRHFGFGLVSVYRSDFDAVGGFDLSIRGWGAEDVNLFDKFVKRAINISVFRAPEPHLIHVYHQINCSRQLSPSQYEMCLGSKASSVAGIDYLYELYHSKKYFS